MEEGARPEKETSQGQRRLPKGGSGTAAPAEQIRENLAVLKAERLESLAREVYLLLLESPAAATTKPEAMVAQAWAKARVFTEYQPEG